MKLFATGWLALGISALIVLLLPALLFRSIVSGTSTPIVSDLNANGNPDYVFIGNSMTDTRINPELFAELTGVQNVELLTNFGLTSAGWYLLLKNYVVAQDTSPKAVIVMFRDEVLTDPLHRTTGVYRGVLNRLKSGSEPDYDAVIDANTIWDMEIERSLESFYAIQTYRMHAEEALSRSAAGVLHPSLLIDSVRHLIGAIQPDAYRARLEDHLQIKRATNEVFDRANFRPNSGPRNISSGIEPFSEVVEESFLPLMIELATEIDTQIIFVRLQRRPDADGVITTEPTLAQYLRNAQEFIQANGAIYIDMNGANGPPLEYYLDGDHIGPFYRDLYTQLFADVSAPYIE